MLRTHFCGHLSASDQAVSVTLGGWVNRRRDLGKLLLVDLRDHTGIIQLNFEGYSSDMSKLDLVQKESVIIVKGDVQFRPKAAVNKKLKTGMIEIKVNEIEIESFVQKGSLPFLFDANVQTKDSLRLKHRYLELRDEKYQTIIKTRSKVMNNIRQFMIKKKFVEVDTPMLFKPTPEGARDFLIPSRSFKAKMYALPQSPQLLKQLLMISGLDRYFQIVKCFRDEDQRSDRQPEFSQIDLEASFIEMADIKSLSVELCKNIFHDKNYYFKSISYQDSMEFFGCDKPDLRYGLVIADFDKIEFNKKIKVLDTDDYSFSAIFVPEDLDRLARKKLDQLKSDLLQFKTDSDMKFFYFKTSCDSAAGGNSSKNSISSGIAKYLSNDLAKEIFDIFCHSHKQATQFLIKDCSSLVDINSDFFTTNGTVLIVGHKNKSVKTQTINYLRQVIAKDCNLIDDSEYAFAWVYDFPLFEYDYQAGLWHPSHHPFSAPRKDQFDKFYNLDENLDLTNPDLDELKYLIASSCDMVCNGYELGSGSIRLHDPKSQIKMFKILQMNEDQYMDKFGFLLNALKYGAPPHGGIALGLDRIMMLYCQVEGIKDVIAFPKNTQGACIMSQAPTTVSQQQLTELGLKV